MMRRIAIKQIAARGHPGLQRIGRGSGGFTLIEILIVVAVIAILAAIAYPSYQSYIRKARRADAKEALLRVQIEQEKYRTNNTAYTYDLGTDTDGLGILTTANQLTWSPGSPSYYTVQVTAGSASATGYTVTATATGTQTQDTACPTLTLLVAATGEQKTPAACW